VYPRRNCAVSLPNQLEQEVKIQEDVSRSDAIWKICGKNLAIHLKRHTIRKESGYPPNLG